MYFYKAKPKLNKGDIKADNIESDSSEVLTYIARLDVSDLLHPGSKFSKEL